jgi:ABC-type transporter Mla maintaining outer membrane lipid asymmetry ATPase subunit MlaF
MPRKVTARVECAIDRSFKVEQVAGMFDLTLAKTSCNEFCVEVPGDDEPWQIGAIVGPSGSGKSTIARHAFGEKLYAGGEGWPKGAVIDGFGSHSIRDITRMLTVVGFSSPPAWVRPYHVLSNGEKFRCDLARALLATDGLVAFDEFTSLVDRTVAKIGSAAVAKAIRAGRAGAGRKFVAVSCHYDILEWLCPDWVVDMATQTLARGSLRRPPINLELYRCDRDAWPLFARTHYLSGSLPAVTKCLLACWQGTPVAFCAFGPTMGYKGYWRISRIVVLPDYQGIGVGSVFRDAAAAIMKAQADRVGLTTSHPAMIQSCARSPLWRVATVLKLGSSRGAQEAELGIKRSTGRSVASFEYIGPASYPWEKLPR